MKRRTIAAIGKLLPWREADLTDYLAGAHLQRTWDIKMAECKSSQAWAKELGIHVLDPDGWDRRHFDASWNEPISRKEFDARLSVSTITKRVEL